MKLLCAEPMECYQISAVNQRSEKSVNAESFAIALIILLVKTCAFSLVCSSFLQMPIGCFSGGSEV